MLQISTGKFYEQSSVDDLFVTVHRGLLYTNYHFLPDRINTPIGSLLAIRGAGKLCHVVCEVTERLPKPTGETMTGVPVSVGQNAMINDFAAIVSFFLNITCDPNHDLVQRLTVAPYPALGAIDIPADLIPRVFDAQIDYRDIDFKDLNTTLTALLGLRRKAYLAVIRAIRRYVTAMHRMADDLDLAYALLVASIESLAQNGETDLSTWADYEQGKRKRIDEALTGANEEAIARVRKAILTNEHVGLARKFVDFSSHHLDSSYFRMPHEGHPHPAGKSEIRAALKRAYELRSRFLHTLSPLPRNLTQGKMAGDVQYIDEQPHLTFRGLAHVARYVIHQVIGESPKVTNEKYDFTRDYPGVLHGQLASRYWIGRLDGYSADIAPWILGHFIRQCGEQIADNAKPVSDMRAVLGQIRRTVPTLGSDERKIAPLALHVLFEPYLSHEERYEAQLFSMQYRDLFDKPSVESLFTHFLIGMQIPVWPLSVSDSLMRTYHVDRPKKLRFDGGPLVSAALTLWLAEQYRQVGDVRRAEKLIADAVEEYPCFSRIGQFERAFDERLQPIDPWQILLPRSSSPAT